MPGRYADPATDAGRPASGEDEKGSMSRLKPKIGVVRNLGPTSWQVADVASGRVDMLWEFGRDVALLPAEACSQPRPVPSSPTPEHPADLRLAQLGRRGPRLHAKVIEILADVTVDSYEAAG
jgi:myo-inositol-1(or 4)-monophosphatase